jgi:phosphoribosylformimino-5-aminoimidazole carboxamide ribotide isomerase
LVRVRGWQEGTHIRAIDLAERLAEHGLRWLIFTDVSRDGVSKGLNLPATLSLAALPGLQVIASGGVREAADVRRAREASLAGVIAGRALYEGTLRLEEVC